MEKRDKNNADYYTIDVAHILRSLWKRAWLIILCGIVAASVGFSIASFTITPTYSSNVKLYVNNSSFSISKSSFSITTSELTAAQSLVKTYSEILTSRSTLERVIERAHLKYNWKQLAGIITCASSNDTEIMKVTVTCEDPYVASSIANTIAEVLPVRISEIIDGASMEVVDSAVPDLQKVAPSVTRYTALGLLIGALLAAVIIAIFALLDDTIYDEEYILQNYDFPILGKVPDLLNSSSKTYGYYYQSSNRDTK